MYRRARDPALACAPRGGGLPEEVVQAFLDRCRVAHLATADRAGTPHVIPICFACDWAPPEGAAGWHIYSVIDAKPKCVVPLRLKRVRNVLENPQVALVADRYDEDWSRLGYVLVTGTATVITEGPAHARALALLRDKYPQYRTMDLERAPVLQITPCRWVSWGNLNGAVKTVPPTASSIRAHVRMMRQAPVYSPVPALLTAGLAGSETRGRTRPARGTSARYAGPPP